MDHIYLTRWTLKLHRGLRFPRLGFEIFRGFDGHWYLARLPVGYPHKIF